MEHATIGDSKVNYQGAVIATYEWLGDTDIPYFTFKTSAGYYPTTEMVKTWERNQLEKWGQAIKDAEDAKPESCKECPKHKLETALYKDLYEKHVNKQSKIG